MMIGLNVAEFTDTLNDILSLVSCVMAKKDQRMPKLSRVCGNVICPSNK